MAAIVIHKWALRMENPAPSAVDRPPTPRPVRPYTGIWLRALNLIFNEIFKKCDLFLALNVLSHGTIIPTGTGRPFRLLVCCVLVQIYADKAVLSKNLPEMASQQVLVSIAVC